MKYKVGDVVKVRSDLDVNKRYKLFYGVLITLLNYCQTRIMVVGLSGIREQMEMTI